MSYLPSNNPDLLLAIIDCYFKKTYLKKMMPNQKMLKTMISYQFFGKRQMI